MGGTLVGADEQSCLHNQQGKIKLELFHNGTRSVSSLVICLSRPSALGFLIRRLMHCAQERVFRAKEGDVRGENRC